MSPLSPLAVFNRATLLLARNSWRLLITVLVFGVLPSQILQYVYLRAGYPEAASSRLELYIRGWGYFLCYIVIGTFGYSLANRLLVDDLDGRRRPLGVVLADGAQLFVRASWLLVPATLANYWLTYYASFFPGLALCYLLAFFLPHYAVGRQTMKVCWKASVALAKRYSPAILLNLFIILGLQFGIHKAFETIDRHWNFQRTAPELSVLIGLPFGIIFTMLFTAWSMALYGTLRERLQDQPLHTAAIFD